MTVRTHTLYRQPLATHTVHTKYTLFSYSQRFSLSYHIFSWWCNIIGTSRSFPPTCALVLSNPLVESSSPTHCAACLVEASQSGWWIWLTLNQWNQMTHTRNQSEALNSSKVGHADFSFFRMDNFCHGAHLFRLKLRKVPTNYPRFSF